MLQRERLLRRAVTVTTPTSPGNYSGTLSGTTSAGGTVGSYALSMTVTAPANTAAFTMVSSTGLSTTFENGNAFAVTPSASGIVVTNGSVWGSVTSNTCTGSIAAGATCTITIVVPAPDCKLDNYNAHSYVTDGGGTAVGNTVFGSSTRTQCN